MAIKKIEMRPKLSNGTYGDVVYPKTSVDMVDGLQASLDAINASTNELSQTTTALKVNKLNKDANGVFTTIETRRKSNNTLFQRSVLSGGASPKYTTRTVTTYAANGTTLLKTDVYTLTYDADGALESEV